MPPGGDKDFMSDRAYLKDQLFYFLSMFCRGRACAIKAHDIGLKIGVSLREVNDLIRELRKEGKLIGSAKEQPYGYYLPVSEQEVDNYLHSFKGELFDMLETFNRQRRARKLYIESQNQDFMFKVGAGGQIEMAVGG